MVFKQPAAHQGLTADPVATVHEAVREASPGLVELWPLVEPDEKTEVEPGISRSTPPRRPARASSWRARSPPPCKAWLGRGDLVGDGDKRHPLRAGDILVLVRQRGPLFEAIIRALKTAGIAGGRRRPPDADRAHRDHGPAGAGRRAAASAGRSGAGDGAEEPAVRHLARTSCSSWPATASARCAPRCAPAQPDLAARARCASTRRRERLSPFAFYAELLGGGGRKAFLARLGPEANDALDEFLNLALDYESRETPSLQGFVAWLRTASTEVKRDMEIARDEVRVMTVHGAKGLEAPIVMLADTTTVPAGPADPSAEAARRCRRRTPRPTRPIASSGCRPSRTTPRRCGRARDDDARRTRTNIAACSTSR